VDVGDRIEQKEHPCSKKDDERHLPARLAVDLRHQVSGRNVNRHSRRKRQSVTDFMAKHRHGQHSGQG
jgi:hypothetical protein